jgi:hypothetical protein
MEFLSPLKDTAFAVWVSQSGSLLGYPTFLFLHTFGLATVAGLSSVINLRVLGMAHDIPLTALQRLFPALWIAFAVTAFSGLTLLITDIVTKTASPVFYVKMACIALALRNGQTGALPKRAKTLAISTLLLWVAATTAGRLMAYVGSVNGF